MAVDLGYWKYIEKGEGLETTGVGGGEDEQRALEVIEGEGRDGFFISRKMGISMIHIVRRLGVEVSAIAIAIMRKIS